MEQTIRLVAQRLAARQAPDTGQELLDLLSNPFKQTLNGGAIWSALATGVGFSAFIAIAFSLMRPHNSVVYAPKLKHADEKHAPPPIGKGYHAWVMPLWRVTEKDIVQYAGLDAAIFMRFTIMCRNIMISLAIVGCGILIPIYMTNLAEYSQGDATQWFMKTTPQNVYNQAIWGIVVVGYMFNFIVCGWLWWNYRKVLALRRTYFESEDYQRSLHARTLMLNDIPKDRASDEGIARLIDGVIPESSFARTAVARNVKHLPTLISQHDSSVRKLEKVLAKYLKDPQNLPAARPMCHPSKKDPSYSTYPKGQKVDAIEYLTQRIRELETEIKEARLNVDKRSSQPYGFASYDDISEAHSIAFTLRKQKPSGATITLAPRPNDIIWDNMPLSPSARAWRRILNNVWIILLTFIWVVPNIFITVFLVNLTNLGLVWKGFQDSLAANTTFWSIVQGVVAPGLMSLLYLVLPIIFRRLSIRAGDRTKTGRERHVVAKLFAFFIFNNLVVFSLFSSIWGFVASIISDTSKGTDAGQAIFEQNYLQVLFVALCDISPYWVTWLLQRNLGAAIDLAQLWTLIWKFFMRKMGSPTPREMIELTAPPPFDYASYYNYYLFYVAVALGFSVLQPLVLAAATLYFAIDVWIKKYLILYVFVTKTESGGLFWRLLFNRVVFGMILADLVIFLTTWTRGDGTHIQAFAVVPLPIIMIIFKVYCSRVFDHKVRFYSTRDVRKTEASLQKDPYAKDNRLASRFGHPALYKPLITPMVHAKAQNILASIYKGRLTDGRDADSGDVMSTSGYSDAYVLNSMHAGRPGKSSGLSGFEIVSENKLDFEYYKNRPEFASEHGGGDIYGRPIDAMRPGTPGSMWNGSDPGSAPGSPGMPPRNHSPGFSRNASPGPLSPFGAGPEGYRSRSPLYGQTNESSSGLVGNAASMPMTVTPGSRERSMDRSVRAPGGAGMLGGGPRGYGGLPQEDDMASPDHDPMQYDYFRSSRGRKN